MNYTREDLINYTHEELLDLRQGEQSLLDFHSCPTPNTPAGRARAKDDAAQRIRLEANIALIDSLVNV